MGYVGDTSSLRTFSPPYTGKCHIFYQHGTYQVLYRKRQETLLQNKPMPPSDHPCHLQADLLCGLRPNEGRELKRSDFCYKDRTLFIRKNKSHQERLIPVAGDLAEMCRNYMNKRMEVYPDTEYMFPSTTGKPYQKRWLVDMRIHSAVYGQHKTQKNAM